MTYHLRKKDRKKFSEYPGTTGGEFQYKAASLGSFEFFPKVTKRLSVGKEDHV
jgi:hypothetical protein